MFKRAKQQIWIETAAMKKILCASLIALSTSLSFAAPANPEPSNSKTTVEDKEMAAVETLLRLKNFKGAYSKLEEMAKKDHPKALYNLANMTDKGIGIKADEKKALELYKKSAQLSFAPAQHALGMIYGNGLNGIEQDLSQAKKYFQQAAQNGLEQANIDLSVLLLEKGDTAQQAEALKILEPYVQKGHHQAIYTKSMFEIAQGVAQKSQERISQAVKTLQPIAEQGYVPALFALGTILKNGQLIKQNLPEAKKIFTALDKAKIPKAKENLREIEQMMKTTKPAKK